MFATAAVATALALTTLAPTATTTDPDLEVIQVFVFNRGDLQPFEAGTYGGTCPPSHPYLYDEFYAAGRWAPHGVRVVSDTLVAVTINPKYPTPVDAADESSKNYWSGISGDYLNWEVRPASLSVTMECTSNTWKAWKSHSVEL
ncbi:hypothetical protein [Agromyces sp. Soil535]|uniref:hypothetical protein n=1 Tax=Agromyces sp. Soil535 TaxID=1736390 RepID=UPI0006F9871E|nr:hypothetical protein [Agromyces sp. Soil535]KRE28908.1 hypothetical protein ASG80_20770 [Agromyces sp. Soil535]